jgi:uncharacterized protein (TIGR03084 family)
VREYREVLADLRDEEAALDHLVADIDADGWAAPTPASGWDVRDTVAHLAVSEELAASALTDEDAFAERLTELAADLDATEAALLAEGRATTGPALLERWRGARFRTLDALRARTARDRVPWINGTMSAMSFATSRLMETWAHGQDTRDALGAPTGATARLRHVADLGVRTRPFAYAVRGRRAPDTPVRVELVAPDGSTWAWGDETSADVVRGPALDFCRVVTQRVHPADTELEVRGDASREWLQIAQAFAGPPTAQRPATRTDRS